MERFNNPAFPCQFSNYTKARSVRRPMYPTTWVAPAFAFFGGIVGIILVCVL